MDTDHRPEDGVEGDRGRAPNSHCSEKAMADNTTETPAANAGTHDPAHVARQEATEPRNSAQPAKAGTTAMLTVL